MEILTDFEDFKRKHLQQGELNERRNVLKIEDKRKLSIDYNTISRILKRTSYVAGESAYFYNLLSFYMIKRIF